MPLLSFSFLDWRAARVDQVGQPTSTANGIRAPANHFVVAVIHYLLWVRENPCNSPTHRTLLLLPNRSGMLAFSIDVLLRVGLQFGACLIAMLKNEKATTGAKLLSKA
jgi:hypothetical protein